MLGDSWGTKIILKGGSAKAEDTHNRLKSSGWRDAIICYVDNQIQLLDSDLVQGVKICQIFLMQVVYSLIFLLQCCDALFDFISGKQKALPNLRAVAFFWRLLRRNVE